MALCSWRNHSASRWNIAGADAGGENRAVKVLNIHERELSAPSEQAGALIDTLASRQDVLWPSRNWPRMEFDRPLQVGAVGGHGPIRYFVEAYAPGRSVSFRFTGPMGFDGRHGYEVVGVAARRCVLRHTLDMRAHGPARVTWPAFYRPLHDALLEDSMAQAQASLGQTPLIRKWSLWVRLLRWIASKGRSRAQARPVVAPRRDAFDRGL